MNYNLEGIIRLKLKGRECFVVQAKCSIVLSRAKLNNVSGYVDVGISLFLIKCSCLVFSLFIFVCPTV